MYKKQTLPAIIFLVAAVLSLIFAISCFTYSLDSWYTQYSSVSVEKVDDYTWSYTFGADYYTYSQNAMADAANNAATAANNAAEAARATAETSRNVAQAVSVMYNQSKMIKDFAGYAFLVVTLVLAAIGIGKLTSTPAVQPVAVTNSQQIADTVSANFIKTPEAEVEEEAALPTLE